MENRWYLSENMQKKIIRLKRFLRALLKLLKPYWKWAFLGCSLLSKICQTYPTMMKLDIVISYLKKIQEINKPLVHPLSSADISIFSLEISNFCYIKKYRHRLHFNTFCLIILTFFESWKVVLINMVTILIMSAKLVTLRFLKTQVFWNKGFDVIISVHDVINKI